MARRAFIEAIQTGERETTGDTAVLGVRQSDYGKTNGEIFLEMYTWAALEREAVFADPPELNLETRRPDARMVLDHVAARKLINELSLAFDLDVHVTLAQRIGMMR